MEKAGLENVIFSNNNSVFCYDEDGTPYTFDTHLETVTALEDYYEMINSEDLSEDNNEDACDIELVYDEITDPESEISDEDKHSAESARENSSQLGQFFESF